MVVVFDLDDTLYKEIDFLNSGFRVISHNVAMQDGLDADEVYKRMVAIYTSGENAFVTIKEEFGITASVDDMICLYRSHSPDIRLENEVVDLLDYLRLNGHNLGLLTDGRGFTQRNKIKSLGLDSFIAPLDIVISEEFGSEKPDQRNYSYFMNRYPGNKYLYVGDNIKKDFLAPNQLGWQTVCLRADERNIHKQDVALDEIYMPHTTISNIQELKRIIK